VKENVTLLHDTVTGIPLTLADALNTVFGFSAAVFAVAAGLMLSSVSGAVTACATGIAITAPIPTTAAAIDTFRLLIG
jgi:hypothetical protein